MKAIENKGAKYKQNVEQGIKSLKINTNNYDEYLKAFQEPVVKEKVENE